MEQVNTIDTQETQLDRKGNIVILLMMLLFPYIQFRTYDELPNGYGLMALYFYRYTAILSGTIIYSICRKNKEIFKNKKFLYLFVAYWCAYLLSTFLNDFSSFSYVASRAYSDMALVLLITLGCCKWKKELLQALTNIYCGWIYLNFILDILYPDGLYATATYHTAHLLGDDNAMVYVMLPGVILTICNSLLKNEALNTNSVLIILVSSYSLLSVWSVSAFLSILLFVMLYIFQRKIKLIDPRFLLLGLIATIVFCFIGLGTSSFVENFVEKSLDKDVTLTGRTLLWAQAIFEIMQRPFWGYGGYFQYGSWTIEYWQSDEYPCHTPYLQLLLDGGFILFGIFLTVVVKACETIRKNQTFLGYVLAAGLVAMMFNYITEYSQLFHMYIILTLMFNINSLTSVVAEIDNDGEE